jgi:putative endonuclease
MVSARPGTSRTATRSRSIGDVGERIAEAYLAARGCRVVDRNVHVDADEIDLIVREGRSLVAVEVKCSTSGGDPLEAVDDAKFGRLVRAVVGHHDRIDRIDLVAVRTTPELVELRWLRGVW